MKSRVLGIIKPEHHKADGKRFLDKIHFCCYNTQKKELTKSISLASEHTLFMLSTGLQDENGQFAYHLDILENHSGERWLVEWDNGMFFLSSFINGSTRPILKVKHYKIVGNLFENLEWLNNINIL